ncbi:uncharacterized protein LOC133531666 isoform X1 [Cydia pomonella]|uniref:uncharacterized protein LOC133531666 isoform X1 n=1 Tax=Cydia pomonella TaxID=82600 RepID=UPI002ADE0CD2|nr:uncharacterized protein LOC133531666 isoform X1 [Cydia pomonella]
MSVQKNNGPIIDPALCRCCRAIKKCRVLTAEYNWMGKKEVYADMVMDCYGILLSHVDDNEKDSGVCATCVVRLREAIAFRHQVLQCEELFLQAKLAPPEEDTNNINYENKLKKLELENIELKTEPKDYNSDHNSVGDDRHDALPTYSDDEDNKPLKPESKPDELPLKDEEMKSEDSEEYNGSSSDSDEPIKKKVKRKKKTNGKEKKKTAKKQKADTDQLSEATEPGELEPALLTEEIHIKDEIQIEFSEESSDEYSEVPIDNVSGHPERKKRKWVRDRSEGETEYEQLCKESDEVFYEHMNMSKASFEELHSMVELLIEKTDTNFRKSISTRERLAICLRHLRAGLSYKELSTKYRVGRTTVSAIVKDVSRALWGTLQPAHMPAPRERTWRRAEADFKLICQFPNCVGSVGGRHIIAKQLSEDKRYKTTPQTEEYPRVSDKNCHRRFVTIALLAVTDPYNKILALDIGNYAKDGHVNILENSRFFGKYMDKKDFLPWTPLPGETEPCPYVLISDGAFTIRHNLLRVFPKTQGFTPQRKLFNQYLEKACTVDKTFEMLMKSWTILLSPMETQIDTAVAMLKAICCLHNYVLAKHGKTLPYETQKKIVKGGAKKLNALKLFKPTNHRASNVAVAVRDRFLAYFRRLEPIDLTDDPIEEDPIELTEVTFNDPDESITEITSVVNTDKIAELDPSESTEAVASFNDPNESIKDHFKGQMISDKNDENNDNTDRAESIEMSDISLDIKIELESVNEPNNYSATVKSLNEPNNDSATVKSLNEPNNDSATVKSLNEPNDSATVESLNEPNESATVESLNEPNESTTVKSLNEPNDSATVESLNEPNDSATVKSLNEPNDNEKDSSHARKHNDVENDDFESINVLIHSDGANKSFDDAL